MTNISKPERDSSTEVPFDGITFEVEEEEHTQEGQKVKRRGIYLWPNLITTAALLSGFYSIIASMNGDFQQAIYAIFIAALLDGLDGRVARFNVQIGVVDKRYFIGVASPLAAIMIVSLVWVGLDFPEIFDIREPSLQVINAVVIIAVGLLMISNIKYYSFKTVERKRVPFFVLPIAVFVFAAMTYNIPVGILVISILYALSGFITTFMAKRSSTL